MSSSIRLDGGTAAMARHARRYHQLLDECWEQTDWSRPQAEVVLRRMESVLEKLPAAKKQARERIIGGRQVASADKILSLYEEDIHVVLRGKAGAEVEFGNTLLLADQADGLIGDHVLFYNQAPSDANCLRPSIERIESLTGRPIGGNVTDRGFDSKNQPGLSGNARRVQRPLPARSAAVHCVSEKRAFQSGAKAAGANRRAHRNLEKQVFGKAAAGQGIREPAHVDPVGCAGSQSLGAREDGAGRRFAERPAQSRINQTPTVLIM